MRAENRKRGLFLRACDSNAAASSGKKRREVGKTRASRPNDHVREVALWRGARFHRGRWMVITVVRERSHRSQAVFDLEIRRFLPSLFLFRSISPRLPFPLSLQLCFLSFPRLFIFPSLFDSTDLTRFNLTDFFLFFLIRSLNCKHYFFIVPHLSHQISSLCNFYYHFNKRRAIIIL